MATVGPGGAEGVPPPTEQVHLPGPSYLPVIVAFATTIALAGVLLSWYVFGLGVIVLVIALARWIRDTREEIAELPLEH